MYLHVARRFPSGLPQIVCRRVNGMFARHGKLGLELLSARVGGPTKLARTQRRKAPVSLFYRILQGAHVESPNATSAPRQRLSSANELVAQRGIVRL